MLLPDILKPNLHIVFCGTAVGDKSAKHEAYYAGPGNVFYSTLSLCGFTPSLIQPSQVSLLTNYGIGLTDLAKFTHGMDKKIKNEDYDVKSFEEKILIYQPQIVCFNGKKAAIIYLGLKKTKHVFYGLQQSVINNTKLFVAPSTSATSKRYWDDSYWRQVKNLINH